EATCSATLAAGARWAVLALNGLRRGSGTIAPVSITLAMATTGAGGAGGWGAAASSCISLAVLTILAGGSTSSATSGHGAFAGIRRLSGSFRNAAEAQRSARWPVMMLTYARVSPGRRRRLVSQSFTRPGPAL